MFVLAEVPSGRGFKRGYQGGRRTRVGAVADQGPGEVLEEDGYEWVLDGIERTMDALDEVRDGDL